MAVILKSDHSSFADTLLEHTAIALTKANFLIVVIFIVNPFVIILLV